MIRATVVYSGKGIGLGLDLLARKAHFSREAVTARGSDQIVLAHCQSTKENILDAIPDTAAMIAKVLKTEVVGDPTSLQIV